MRGATNVQSEDTFHRVAKSLKSFDEDTRSKKDVLENKIEN